MIKAVIFDIGNVVLSYNEKELECALAMWAGVSLAELRKVLPDVFHEWGSGQIESEHEFYRELLTRLGKAPRTVLPERSLVLEGCKEWRTDKSMMRLAARLKKNGYIVAALSNTIEPHAKWIRAQGIYESFDSVVLSHEEGCRKPDPEIYVRTLDLLGVAAESAVFIDDSLANVQGAQRVGIHGIHFKNYVQCKEALCDLTIFCE